jgi:hypothetical protein
MGDLIKLILAVIIAAFVLGFVFSFLFKVGILMLLGLGILYLFRRVFVDR